VAPERPTDSPRVVLAGGGTGGHVFPGLALAEELRRKESGVEVLFVGAPGGIEEKLVPEAGWRLELVESVKVRGKLDYLRLPFALLKAVRAASKLLRAFRPHAVVALGGYAALAPALAARRRGLPVAVLEQNAIPGRVSRFLSRFAAEVHAAYEESAPRFPRPGKVAVSGNPVRRSIIEAAGRRAARGGGGRLSLLVAGGSQGARRLNELFIEAVAKLAPQAGGLRVVHLTGSAHHGAAVKAAGGLPLEVELVAFEKDMAARYADADLILSRAGATGLAEIAVCGLPAILVPFPFAKDNHQEANARAFERAGAARVLLEGSLSGERLAAELRGLMENDEQRAEMAARMKARGRPAAGAEIAGRVLALAGGRA